MDEDFLHKKLEERLAQNAYRRLRLPDNKIDFCSNDYLGIVKHDLVPVLRGEGTSLKQGSRGSRLLSGNYSLIEETEKFIAGFHESPAGLIFNSGYDANTGLLSAIPQRGDTILYDQLSHASIRDGIRLSFAQSFSFAHNRMQDLEEKLKMAKGNIFVVTESVFSMDGDSAPLPEMVILCERYDAHLVVDEAHATGVTGTRGEGLVQSSGLQKKCFARIHTFGKALGCHGAIVLGSEMLRNYLINFSRAFIYTTALPETAVDAIRRAYELLPRLNEERNQLRELIRIFQQEMDRRTDRSQVEPLKSSTPIQAVIVPGNDQVRRWSERLAEANLDVRPILYPSVPRGMERLRIVLHSFNSRAELGELIHCLGAH